jgi:HK97 family phage portal protein
MIVRDTDAMVVANATASPLSSCGSSSELYSFLSNGLSGAGVAVTEQTVLGISAVYSCVNLITGAIASVPLHVYKKTGDMRDRAKNGVEDLLNSQPNPTMTAAVFWEYMVASLLLKGDAFARVLRPSAISPKVTGYDPIHPDRITVKKEGGLLWYIVARDDGKGVEVVHQDDMIHIPGPGFDGLRGKSQIKHVMKNPAGIALAADQYSASFFKNGAKPDFAIEMVGNPNTDQVEEMRRVWTEKYGGVGKSHLPAILFGGSKIHELSINAEDAQLIATRQFQVEDIARIFGVPPHMIGHTTNTTSWGSGVENMGIAFVKYTLGRHLVKIEQEINRKSFPFGGAVFAEFNTAGLERGDYKTRNEGYRIALGRAGEPGWMTINQVRKLENMPPIEGGDELNKGEANAPQPAQKPA